MQDIKPILVPQYEKPTVDRMYSKVKEDTDNFVEYFPDYIGAYISPRKYL